MTTTGMLSATPKVAPWGLEAEPIKDQPALTAAEAKQIAKEESKFHEFVVLLDDQATREVEKAFSMPMGLERRQYVAKTLIDNMIKTQGPIWKTLDALQATGHVSERRGYTPLWVQNSIVVYGDEEAEAQMAMAHGVAQAIKSAKHTLDDPGRNIDLLAPIENAVNGVEALADLPADVGHTAKDKVKGKAAAKPQDLTTDPQWNLTRVQADKAKADGLTGKGVTVGVIDTGFDFSHPFLLSRYRGYDPDTGEVSHVANWFDAVTPKSPEPVDEGRHGTHVGGTIGGSYDGVQTGIAPDVDMVAARGLGPQGGSDGMLLASFQNMVAPRVPVANRSNTSQRAIALGPDIINNSWGSDDGTSISYMHALRNMDAMGVVNFFAAGNDGDSGRGTIGSPGSSPHIITVGATDQNDQPASFSSRGPNPLPVENGEPVPFISAPGVEIRSTVPGGGVEMGWQGTSMATPLMAGFGALIQQAAAEETGAKFDTRAMKEVFRRAAVDIGEKGPDDATGYGIPVADKLRSIVVDVAKDLNLMPKAEKAPAKAK